jgi:hypothetical protein
MVFYLGLLLVIIFDVLEDGLGFGGGVVGLVVTVGVLGVGEFEGGFLDLVEDLLECFVLGWCGLFVDVDVGVVLGDG